jgi:membrane protease YdiL (CAAX protease family)
MLVMSLLAFEHVDREKRGSLWSRPRWRYGAAMLVPLLLALPGIRWAMTFPTQDYQALITETSTYVVFVGVFCWVAWFRRPYGGIQAITMAGLWLLASLLVNFLTKRGQVRHTLSAGLGNHPMLFWGLIFLIPVAALLLTARRDPALQRAGFSQRAIGWQIGAGLVAGAIIGLHFLTTIRFSGITGISAKPMPYVLWSLCYELYQSLAEELFFRGVMLRALQQIYKLDFWAAMSITTVANMSIFLIKTQWQSPLELAGVFLYLSMLSVTACLLYRRFQSVLPGFISNLLFSLLSVVRG